MTATDMPADAWLRAVEDDSTRTAALRQAPPLVARRRREGRHPQALDVVPRALRDARGTDLLARLGGQQALLTLDLADPADGADPTAGARTSTGAEGLDRAARRDAARTLADAADRALAVGRAAAAADHLLQALHVLLHRSLHTLDAPSPLSRKDSGWLDPVTRSAAYTRLHLRTPGAPRTAAPGDRPRVLLVTDGNAHFLGEVERGLVGAGARVTRLDLTGPRADGLVPVPAVLARARLGDPAALAAVDASATAPEVAALLREADTVVVDWCTAAAVWASLVVPAGARLVVRLHSIEAFSVEPHLVDWSRVDDVVLVGAQLESLVRHVVPALAPARTRRGGPRVHVVPNPVALDGPPPDGRTSFDKRPDAARTVAVVGWAQPVKDPLWALEVLDELRQHDPRWRLLLVGADYPEPQTAPARRYRAQVLRRIEAAGDAVRRVGWTADLPEVLRDAGYVLSSSRRESHGVAFCEAVAAGCLPVARDWPDVAEFGGAGEVFPAGWVVRSPREAAARLLALAAEPDAVRARTAADAAGVVHARYGTAAVMPRLLEVLVPAGSADGARSGGGTRPHLVYVAIGFPPAAKSSAYRMRATANLFVDRGWDVTVVTIDRHAWDLEYGLDLSLLDLVDPRVRIVELPLRRADLDPDVRGYSWFRAKYPARWVRLRHRLDTIPFPEKVFGPWRRALERGTEAVVRDRPADLLLVSPAPYTTLAVARHVRRRTGTPYVVDFRDGWSVDVLGAGEAFGARTRRGRWERRVLTGAEAVCTVNEPIAEFYRQRYPELASRVHVARNGFDADLGTDLAVARRPDPAAGLAFGYLGTVNLTPAHLSLVVDAWTAARAQDEVLARSTLTFRGHVGAGWAAGANGNAAVIARAGVHGVTYGGPVAKADVAATYGRWDALLLALAGGRFVTSGKVYEYMATGLPVLSAHEMPHAAQDVLEGYPLWVRPPGLTVEALRDGFVETARRALSASEEDRAAARDHAGRFERSLQLDPVVAMLDERFGRRDPARRTEDGPAPAAPADRRPAPAGVRR
ncbi:MAG: glycosyltransferase [Actinobacteria bacterium]|nr:glycosyltransferase [Actinomycetota bacterium]